ncbi:MAG: OmpA family protein [Rhodospirillales bacterium]|nr:OmpA family protein [Rhodospirillales bacterium]
MRVLFLAAAAALLCSGAVAQAQQSPSADQIIKSLKPSGPLGSGTRGIRPVAPTAPPASGPTQAASSVPMPAGAAAAAPVAPPASPTAAAPAVATPVVATTGGAPSVNLNVEFQTGSATLTPQAMRTLDQLGQALTSKDLASYRFRIAGHTDTVGNPATNKTLSEQRAATVASYLESKFNVAAARLETVGMGEDGLLVPTPPQTPEARNRRVQVINLGS